MQKAVKVLIAAGALVNGQNRKGLTPLHYAATWARLEAVKVLIAARANVNAEAGSVRSDPVLGPRGGDTPLRNAMYQTLPLTLKMNRSLRDKMAREIGKALIAAGAKLDARDKKGMTPLMHAVHFGRREAAKALIAAGARLDIQDVWGNTALSRAAAETENGEIVIALLDAGADACVREQGWQDHVRPHAGHAKGSATNSNQKPRQRY